MGEKRIEGEIRDVNSTAENDPNYDIFKSDLFQESLNKNLTEIQPKKIQAMLMSMYLRRL